MVFDKFEQNSLFVNTTNDAKDKIIEGIKLKTAEIQTVYFRMIIIEEDQKEPLKDDDIYICKENRECVMVSADCCGCGMGGTTTTINKDYLNYWENKLNAECKPIACLAVISNHWTCFATPKCVDGRCQLVE